MKTGKVIAIGAVAAVGYYVWKNWATLTAPGASLASLASLLPSTATPTTTAPATTGVTVAPVNTVAQNCAVAFRARVLAYFNGDSGQASAYLASLTGSQNVAISAACAAGQIPDPVNYGLTCPPYCGAGSTGVTPVPVVSPIAGGTVAPIRAPGPRIPLPVTTPPPVLPPIVPAAGANPKAAVALADFLAYLQSQGVDPSTAYNADQWNYFLNNERGAELPPGDFSTFFTTNPQYSSSSTMSASDFWSGMHSAGLAGFCGGGCGLGAVRRPRTMTHAYRINYRRVA